MAKTIKGSEIIENDHLKNPIKSAEDLKLAYLALDKAVLKLNKDISKMSKGNKGQTAKEIQAINVALVKSTNVRKSAIAIDKQKVQLNKQLKASTDAEVKGALRLSQAKKEQKILLEDEIIQKNKLAGTEEKLLSANKKLRLERKKLNTTTKTGAIRLKEINGQLDKNNAKLEKNADKLKKQKLGIGRYSKALGGLRSGLAKLGLAVGLATVLRNMFNVTKDFDQAQANLSSVLGVTRDEMSKLTEQAKELGATTEFTASQVSQLQLEYAKLGFTQKEIENVTEATLQLASAAGTELANAATITGSTLRAFGLDSSETQRVVDVMAKSFSASSLDIDKFSSAMSNVAPAAKAVGLTIEETTALIGTLTNAGIDASSAGTGLRNMFLDAKKQGIDFEDALDKIANSTDKLGTSFDIFGKKGSALGVILADNRDATAGLTKTLEASGGAAKEMAEKQLDTLQGSLDLLKSAWEGFILGADGASGASEKLKDIIKFLADNLDTILSAIGKVVVLFSAYKVGVIAATIRTQIFGKATTKLGKAFGGPMLVAITAVLFLINEIVKAYKNAWREGKALADVTVKVNEAMAEEQAELDKTFRALARTTAGTKERQDALDATNAKYGLTLQNLSDESAFVDQLTVAYKGLVKQLRDRLTIEIIGEEIKERLKELRSLEAQLKVAQESSFSKFEGVAELFTGVNITEGLQNDISDTKSALNELERELIRLQQLKIDENGRTGKSKTVVDLKRRKEEEEAVIKGSSESTVDIKKSELDELLRLQELQALQLENLLISQGESEEEIRRQLNEQNIQFLKEQLNLVSKLYGDESLIYQKTLLEFNNALVGEIKESTEEVVADVEGAMDDISSAMEKAATDGTSAIDEENKKNVESYKKAAKQIINIFKDIAKNKIEQINREIQSRQDEVSASQEEVNRLQQIGTANSAEAIKAEKIGQAKDKLEIENLEKKKKNLLITITTLERVSQLINSGNNAPFKTAGGEMNSFINSLKGFEGGTDTTIADALGKPHLNTSTDGYIARLDGPEMVMSTKKSKELQRSGIGTTDKLFANAMKWQNQGIANRALSINVAKDNSSDVLLEKLSSRFERAINGIDIPQTEFDMNNLIKTVKGKGYVNRTHYDKPDFNL